MFGPPAGGIKFGGVCDSAVGFGVSDWGWGCEEGESLGIGLEVGGF